MEPRPMVILLIIVFSGFGLISGQIGSTWSPVVQTNLGKIRGVILRTDRGTPFFAFRGIRYAEAPINDRRFRAPVAVSSWSGELDATKDGFMCPQVGKPKELLSEDCLILNVYSKNISRAVSRPVIFYMHGGANIYGGSHSADAAGPEYLMESDIVFVTMNFRLGALGYLSTRTKEAPGNFGYLDQLMALKWVQDHISNFGGNSKSVTIIGMSSGAMAVTLHLASPLSQGLFHRAIAMSGSTTSEHLIDNLYWTQKLAHQTSCPRFNDVDMLDCLRQLKWETIVDVCDSFETYNLANMKWNYEVDGHFLTKRPVLAFTEGNFSKIPILTGITKDEFNYMVFSHQNNTRFLNDVNLNFDKYAQEFFMHNFTNDPKIKKTEKVRSLYLGNKNISSENLLNFGEIFSDSLISHGVHRLVELGRKWVDVYYYRFDFQGTSGVYVNWQGKPLGVNHGDDLQYFLKRQKLKRQISQNDSEWFMVEKMVGILTSFARDGSPQDIDGVKWLPSNKVAVKTLYIDGKVKLGSEPNSERFKLWDTLYPVGKGASSPLSSGISLIIPLVVLVMFIFK